MKDPICGGGGIHVWILRQPRRRGDFSRLILLTVFVLLVSFVGLGTAEAVEVTISGDRVVGGVFAGKTGTNLGNAIEGNGITANSITKIAIATGDGYALVSADFKYLRDNASTNLVSVDISAASVDGGSLPEDAFNNNPGPFSNLTTVQLPATLTHIGYRAFRHCASLALTALPANLTSIGGDAFSNCTSLALTALPTNLTHLGDSAFWSCTSLSGTMTLPNGLSLIGVNPFGYCNALTAFGGTPGGGFSIVDGVLYGDSQTELVAYPAGKTGDSFTVPSTVATIGLTAFAGCTSLTGVTFPASVTSIGILAFQGCTGLTSVSLPTNLTTLRDGVFTDCKSLASVTLPVGLTSIGGIAFQGCKSLASVTLPASVTSIGDDAFQGCTSLTSVTVLAPNPPSLGADALTGTPANLVIYVPAASVNTYKAAWPAYAGRIQAYIPPPAPPAPPSSNTLPSNVRIAVDGTTYRAEQTETIFTITVPYGTDVSSLDVAGNLPAGAKSDPKLPAKHDFTQGPLTLTVTAEDGTKATYTVNVIVSSPDQPTEKQYFTFNVNDCEVIATQNADGTWLVKIRLPFAGGADPALLSAVKAYLTNLGLTDLYYSWVDAQGNATPVTAMKATAPYLEIGGTAPDRDAFKNGAITSIQYKLTGDDTIYVQTFANGGIKLSAMPGFPQASPSGGGSSSGCDAGFGAVAAVMMLCVVGCRKRK